MNHTHTDWEEGIEACFLTERLNDWPVPTVRVNPDTLKTVVKGLLASKLKEIEGIIEGMKLRWPQVEENSEAYNAAIDAILAAIKPPHQ